MNFEEILKQIHQNVEDNVPAIQEEDGFIVIEKNRTFSLPKDFNTTIAYEGDVNSQIVTFICPKIVEGHDLSNCQEKRLRWKNNSSGNEGSTKLSYILEGEDKMLLRWNAPPEAFTKSGILEISISIFDLIDGKLAYSWNTSSLKVLKVGETLNSVGYKIDQERDDYIPAKNEILTINTSTRAINAPSSYNHMFCNYGDVGTSVIFFQINRYIRGIDLLDSGTVFNIYWKLDKKSNIESSLSSPLTSLYAVEIDNRDSEGLVNIIWKPSRVITENSLRYSGNIIIQLEIVSSDGRVWRTSPYNKLTIGASEFSINVNTLPGEEGTLKGYIIDGDEPFEDKQVYTVAGVTKLRTFTSSEPIRLNRNELAIENDEEGNYFGIKIGTTNNQNSNNAPYVALAPTVTVIINGGNALND